MVLRPNPTGSEWMEDRIQEQIQHLNDGQTASGFIVLVSSLPLMGPLVSFGLLCFGTEDILTT